MKNLAKAALAVLALSTAACDPQMFMQGHGYNDGQIAAPPVQSIPATRIEVKAPNRAPKAPNRALPNRAPKSHPSDLASTRKPQRLSPKLPNWGPQGH